MMTTPFTTRKPRVPTAKEKKAPQKLEEQKRSAEL